MHKNVFNNIHSYLIIMLTGSWQQNNVYEVIIKIINTIIAWQSAIVSHPAISVIYHCLSYLIIYHLTLSLIPLYLSYTIAFHSSLSVIYNCVSSLIIYHLQLSVIPHYLQFTIVCHP